MNQLTTLKSLLGDVPENDSVLQFYLDIAKDIICERRNSNIVESQFLNVQIMIAIELYNKRGAEGQIAHAENGVIRTYSNTEVSDSLLNKIPIMVTTPYSQLRII